MGRGPTRMLLKPHARGPNAALSGVGWSEDACRIGKWVML